MKSSLARKIMPAAIAVGLFAAACSSDGGENVISQQIESNDTEVPSTTPREGGEAPDEAPPVDSDAVTLPSVEVDNVSGGKVDLASFADGTKPIIVWAWAPH